MTIGKKYTGGAALTNVIGSVTASVPGPGQTFQVANDAGYPTGGAFVVRWNRGLSDEEKVLCSSRSGAVFTVQTRGYDGTSAQPHNAPTCEHWLDAATVQSLVDHADDVEADPHSTKLLNNARHDIGARHTFGVGTALGNPGTPAAVVANGAATAGVAAGPAKSDHAHAGPVTAVPVSVGSANAAGSGTALALANHVHDLGTGVVDRDSIANGLRVPEVEIHNNGGSTNVANTGTYTQLATKAITVATASVLLITVEASLRAQFNIQGDFDWRGRIQVANADHPTDAAYGVIDGWLENTDTGQSNSGYVNETIAWPVSAGTHTVDFDLQVALGSAGDVNVRDPKLKVAELNIG